MTKVNETVNTKELARTLAERTELLNKGQSEEVVNALADVIFETLVSGKNVKLNGIGVLEARQVEAGTVQNPALYTKLIEQGMSKDDAKA
ncbi:HU family DNA-binding protein [Saccharibacillus brassicae]|uniref:HU family DNA-binding protein n=1 Tax=Saccharibacillus brassicae TaxID=2583377 RepID=A0A4Y6UTV9_SACBS|nr:HU family DNA-binding protein [Saccharibacillus brassicae]QDH19816.1 HU family DNA-binding protein [Saccharibacillus brassicae]